MYSIQHITVYILWLHQIITFLQHFNKSFTKWVSLLVKLGITWVREEREKRAAGFILFPFTSLDPSSTVCWPIETINGNIWKLVGLEMISKWLKMDADIPLISNVYEQQTFGQLLNLCFQMVHWLIVL